MKVQAHAADGFCKKPPSHIRVILFYGPDAGLIGERFNHASLSVVEDLKDPFLVSEFQADDLKEDPAKLFDEAAAQALTGGRRIVRIRDASDGHHKALSAFLDDPVGDALLLITSGDLGPRSKLRKQVEEHEIAAALPCYLDEESSLNQLLSEILNPEGIKIDRDAAEYLINNIGSNRAMSRMEIQKLALFAGKGGHIGYDDTVKLIGDSAATALDDVIHAACEGNSAGLEQDYPRALNAGNNPITIVRSLNNHFLRLHYVTSAVNQGQNLQSAMKALRPPVFFKAVNRFQSQTRIWSEPALASMIDLALKTEGDCKRTGAPAELLCARALQQVAAKARSQAKANQGRR